MNSAPPSRVRVHMEHIYVMHGQSSTSTAQLSGSNQKTNNTTYTHTTHQLDYSDFVAVHVALGIFFGEGKMKNPIGFLRETMFGGGSTISISISHFCPCSHSRRMRLTINLLDFIRPTQLQWMQPAYRKMEHYKAEHLNDRSKYAKHDESGRILERIAVGM